MTFEEWWEKDSGWGGVMLAEGHLAKAAWEAATKAERLEAASSWLADGDLIDDAEMRLENARERFLKRRGWHPVCNVPGSFWVWQKELKDGRTALVPISLAVDMQRALDKLDCI
jgi:hypothetical protein